MTSCRRKELHRHLTFEEISLRFENAGPSARRCLRSPQKEIDTYYDQRNKMIESDTPKKLVATLLDESRKLSIGEASHQICVVRRRDSGIPEFIIEPISAYVRRRLLSRLWLSNQECRIEMLELFRKVPGASGMTGTIFEALHQFQFADKIEILAKPMFRNPLDRHSRWHPLFGDFSEAPEIQKAREDVLKSPNLPDLHISISPSRSQPYCHDEELAIEENVYYVPLSENQVAIDSFVMNAGNLYLFQFTHGSTHSVNCRLSATLDKFSGLPDSKDQWHFIFIVPTDLPKFACPHSTVGFLSEHTPYIAQVSRAPAPVDTTTAT